MSKPPRRLLPGHVIDGHMDIYLEDTHENVEDAVRNLREEGERRDRTNDELSKTVTQLLIEKARFGRGRKRGGRAPDMASEAFSALASVQLRRGVADEQLLEDLSTAYHLYGVPNAAARARETLALAKQRLTE